MSWIYNEANYDRKLNNYRDEERTKPLPLRVESSKPKEVLRDWFQLTDGDEKKELRDRIFVSRTKAYANYENLPYFFFQRVMASIKSRWDRLPNTLKRSKPLSPINLETTLH